MMKAIVLARVSDKKQDSNEAQLVRIAEYVRHKSLNVWKTVEIEESSTKNDRKKFQEVIKEIEHIKEPIALVVDTVDRLQRSFKESVQLDELRKKGKIEIHFYRENLVISQTSNSADLLRWDMAVMFARSYVLQLSDNVKRKIEQMVIEGKLPGKPPYGYINYLDEEGKKNIKPHPFNSKVVKEIYSLYASGNHSFQTVRKKVLDDYKVKMSNGNISKILTNTFYYGLMFHKGQLFSHIYETIIDRQLFDKVQEIRNGFNKKRRKIHAKPAVYRGKLTCAVCGCSASPELHKGEFYYQCSESKGKHNAVMMAEHLINNQVSKLFEKLILPEQVISDVLTTLKSVNEGKKEFREEMSRKLNRDLEMYTKRKETLLTTLLDQRITGNEYDKLKVEIDNKIADFNVQISNLGEAENNYYSTIEQVIKLTSRASQIFESSNAEQKRQLIGMTLSNLRIENKLLVSDWVKPFNLIAKYNDHTLGLPRMDSNHNSYVQSVMAYH